MDDTGHDFYAEEITGFFVAPYTANYSFYLAADDEADLSLSCCGDMAGMKVIVRSEKVDFAMPRYTPLAWYGSDRVLMRVRHRDHVGADWLRVGLRVHMPMQSFEGSMPPAEIVRRKSFLEVQKLTMTANVVRERHRMNFLRVLTGSFRVRVRRFAQNFLREGVSGVLRVGATAAELANTLWDTMDLYGRVLECEPTLERTEDADNAVPRAETCPVDAQADSLWLQLPKLCSSFCYFQWQDCSRRSGSCRVFCSTSSICFGMFRHFQAIADLLCKVGSSCSLGLSFSIGSSLSAATLDLRASHGTTLGSFVDSDSFAVPAALLLCPCPVDKERKWPNFRRCTCKWTWVLAA
ncbi:unnamed protein product [Symbiodinium sp. CCMP2592]|nr:unnamed protein product [Symbiodinium sp. CCMP2592]